jgi:hypothetical protein
MRGWCAGLIAIGSSPSVFKPGEIRMLISAMMTPLTSRTKASQ